MARSILCAPTNTRSLGRKPKAGDVHENAQGAHGEIVGDLQALRDQAIELRSEGLELLRKIEAFDGDISEVTFNADISGDYDLRFPTPPAPPSFYDGHVDISDWDVPPTIELEGFRSSNIQSPPTMTELTWPEEPVFEGWGDAPADPNIEGLGDIPDPPDVDISVDALPELPSINDGGLDDDFDIDYLDIEPPRWADMPEPDEGQLDRIHSLQAYVPFDEYTFYIAEEGLSTAERLLNLDFVLDLAVLEEGTQAVIANATTRYANRLLSLWSRRGIASPRQGAAAYHQAVRERAVQDTKDQFAAAQHRWSMKLIPTAVQLCVDAHSFFVEQLSAILDANFDALAEEQQTQISLYKQAALQYRKAVDRIRIEVAKYRQQLMQVQKAILEYNVFVEEQKHLARFNQIKEQIYSTEERIKASQLVELEANIAQSKAQLSAYAAAMRGTQAKARALGVDLAKFEAESTKWQSDFSRLRADYQIRRSQNQAIVTKNRAEASKVSAEGLEVEAVKGEAVEALSEVTTWSTNLRQQILRLMTQGLATDRNNTREGLQYQINTAKYRLSAAQYEADSTDSISRNSAITQVNSTLGQLADSVNDSMGRAAELTHQYQVQMSQAAVDYARHRAQGEAAQVSGAASSIRATQGLQARQDTRYQSRISESTDEREAFDTANSNRCRTIYREAYY